MLWPFGPYPVGLHSLKTSNLVSHCHIRGVLFLNFLDQMSVAKVMRSSTLALFTLLAAARARESVDVSIHWTVLSNFYFLVHPQIMHCLKDITHVRTFMHVTQTVLKYDIDWNINLFYI